MEAAVSRGRENPTLRRAGLILVGLLLEALAVSLNRLADELLREEPGPVLAGAAGCSRGAGR